MTTAVPQRLQKVLAALGLGSRREIEGLIVAGLIKVNGKTAVLGTKVSDVDVITVRGKNVTQEALSEHRVIIYNKPVGEICTRSDPEGRITVFENLPRLQKQRWVGIGRLDINSCGLILFTTDGEFANQLMHPRGNIEREYAVRVLGEVTPQILQNLRAGVTLDDGTSAKFDDIRFVGGTGANSWYHVILSQGRYREVRRIWETQGLRVSRLIRVRYGNIELPRDLPEGNYRELDYEKTKRIFTQA